MTKPTRAEREKILAMLPEDYMNPVQQDYFRRLIRHERQEVLDHIDQMKQQLQDNPETGDEGDIAIREEQLRLLFRQIDRESRLLRTHVRSKTPKFSFIGGCWQSVKLTVCQNQRVKMTL